RRHTRSKRDWSSDVCSSDLASIPLEESRARFTESIEILEKAFNEETFSYEGEYYSVENVSIVPRPLQKPRILTGGVSQHNYELEIGRASCRERWQVQGGVVV